ncbi:Astacin (Peptidase M12A) [Parelaphostrongylus tenuis]|uniref:Metalloendopeptidase n=1 Tax=Parelaphostrongylus tenuis TaxID=148309 RepID=A0AAD5WLF6_PARTN|nr:Astacin (Peptidase M12A) [Parelaphostrongylus tenuis]
MRVILLICFATYIGSERSFEGELIEGNQLLRNKLHTVENEITNECSKKSNADELRALEEQIGENTVDRIENKGERSKRQAYHNKNYPKALWSNGINYVFWNTTEDKVNIIDYGGCFSHLGKIGGGQILSLGNRCAHVGIALHQLGHTIGLFHTQTRHDRDNFITPHYENLIDGLNPGWYFGNGNNQFDMESPRMNYNYNITYDFGTVMDYGATAFAKFAMSMCITAKTR